MPFLARRSGYDLGRTVTGPSGDGVNAIARDFSAVTDQYQPSKNVLVQEVSLSPGLAVATMSWADRWDNLAGFVVRGLELFESGLQEYRVEIRDAANNTLEVAYSTGLWDDPFTDWRIRSVDLSPYIGQTVKVLFIEVDSFGPFNVHVDDVTVTVRETPYPAIPATTPLTLAGLAAGLALMLWWSRARGRPLARQKAS